MSDSPISSESAYHRKGPGAQDTPVSGSHSEFSQYKLSPRPTRLKAIAAESSEGTAIEQELLLPEIIRNIPDIVYEFARDAVLALSEREHFTPSEIRSLKKSEVTVGGIEILGRRISEETTVTLAVYVGAVRTYLPPGQWETDDSGLFAVFGEKIGEDRPK
ncbi:MAG: hypothetical protein ACO3XO_04620, partial [Bdellovibrionota bacterium]